MASTKKKEKQSSLPPSAPPETLLGVLGHYVKETQKLEAAYLSLCRQFNELRASFESSNQTMEQLIHYLPEGLLFVNEDGIVLFFNPVAAEVTGLNREEVVKRCYWESFSDSLFGFSMTERLQEKKGGQKLFLTLGNRKEVEVATSYIPKKGMLLLLRDRTDQQKMQSSLNQSERLRELGEMAATLAHEIRNPLGGIEGFAQLLKRDLPEPSHQRMVEAILQGTGALNRLVSHVLDYSRPLKLHFTPTDLVKLIRESCALFQAAPNSPIIQFKTYPQSLFLSLDRDRIQSVILNLLRNAAEAGAGQIKLTLTKKGHLTIQDDGKGMESEEIEKLFTPFFTTKSTGTGLGLATSLSTLEAHGGKIEVFSKPGAGSKFTIQLSLQ